MFHTFPFSFEIVVALGAVGSVVLWVEELRKWLVRKAPAANCRDPLPDG